MVKLLQFTFLTSFSNYQGIIILNIVRNEAVAATKTSFRRIICLKTLRLGQLDDPDNSRVTAVFYVNDSKFNRDITNKQFH